MARAAEMPHKSGCAARRVRVRHRPVRLALLLLLTLGAARAGAAPAGARAAASAPPLVTEAARPIPTCDDPPACVHEGQCEAHRFRRPLRCSEDRGWFAHQPVLHCTHEQWRTVYIDNAGRVVQASPPGPEVVWARERGKPGTVPIEMARLWRRCTAGREALFEQDPRVLKRFPHPQLGHCYLFRPDEFDAPDALEGARLNLLDGLHPYVRDAAFEFARRAAAAGSPIRFISGNRAWKPRPGWRTRGCTHCSSWHAWGVSFDFNLQTRKSMKDALDHYSEDAKAWQTLADILADVGLYWGGHYRRSEVFHVEWHPGFSGHVDRDLLLRFLRRCGPAGENISRGWTVFEPDGGGPEPPPLPDEALEPPPLAKTAGGEPVADAAAPPEREDPLPEDPLPARPATNAASGATPQSGAGAEAAGRAEKPGKPTKPKQVKKPKRAKKPKKTQKSEKPKPAKKPDKPQKSEKPKQPKKTPERARAAKPDKTPKPPEAAKPDRAPKPKTTKKPSSSRKAGAR